MMEMQAGGMQRIEWQGIIIAADKLFLLYISICIGIVNNFYYADKYVMMALVLAELLILLFLLARGREDKFICYFVLFLSSSLESTFQISGEEVQYGFKAFKIFGVNISVYVILFFSIYFIVKYKTVYFFRFKPLRNLQAGSLLLVPVGCLSGIVTIARNYNNIRSYDGYLIAFLRWGYTYALIAFEIFLFSQVVYRTKSLKLFKDYLLYIAAGQICAALVSWFFHNYSYIYGKAVSVIAPITLIHITYLILFPMYQDYSRKQKYLLFLLSSANTFSTILFAGGQEILIIAMIPFVMLLLLLENKEYKKIMLFMSVCFLLGLILLPVLFSVMMGSSSSVKLVEEFGDVVSMIAFWRKGWIQNMHHSPKVRVVEIINILYEYMKSPGSFLFGRGFLGTYRDNFQLLDFVVPEDYLLWERMLGSYSSVHESFAQFLLYFGLFGLLFYFCMIKDMAMNLSKSPWLLAGLLWFGLHYAFSLTAISYGALSLVVGFFDVWEKKNVKGRIDNV